jgi:L-alanine-DL-glutamate epimerase-like enolase superfamily enzyme
LTGEAGKEVLIPLTEMFRRFHINGRTGPVVYALSAIEIALWDIAGKLASSPIASFLGGAPRELTAYASLLRYAEPELVASAIGSTSGLVSLPSLVTAHNGCALLWNHQTGRQMEKG